MTLTNDNEHQPKRAHASLDRSWVGGRTLLLPPAQTPNRTPAQCGGAVAGLCGTSDNRMPAR